MASNDRQSMNEGSQSDTSGGRSIVDDLTSMGWAVGKRYAQSEIKEGAMEVFADYGPQKLREFIATDYPLVQNEMPEWVKGTFHQLPPRYDEYIEEHITPERIVYYLDNPEEWMDVDAAPEQATRMRECADVIRDMDNGHAWLEDRVLHIYWLSGMIPETPNNTDVNT